MAAGHVNQAQLESNYQDPGQVYLDTKTEGALQVLANQINDNFDAADAGSSLITGPTGSQHVGSPTVPNVTGTNVYDQLVSMEGQIQSVVNNSIPVGTITESMLSTDLQNQIESSQNSYMSRQAIVNGNFDVWSTGTTPVAIVHGVQTSQDRWTTNSSVAVAPTTFTRSRQTLTPGDIASSYYYLRINTDGITTDNAGNFSILEQTIENATRNLAGAGKSVTVSFWARSSVASKRLAINITQEYGTGGSPTAAEQLTGTVFTLTSTWTKYTFTFNTNTLVGKTFGTNADDLMRMRFWMVWGSNFFSRFGASTSELFPSGTVDIAQVQLNAGDVAAPFMPKSSDAETMDVYGEQAYNVSMARQAIINGNFDIWQRGTSFTTTTNNYSADRWTILRDGSGEVGSVSQQSFTTGQVIVPNEPKFFFRRQVTTAATGQTYHSIMQRIESVRSFAGQTVTLSFWAKSDAPRTINTYLKQYFGSGGSADIFTGSVNHSITTTWQKFTSSYAIPSIAGKTIGSGANDYLSLEFSLPQNVTFTIDIAQVQLCAGDSPLPFMPKSYDDELKSCMRYYQAFTDATNTQFPIGTGVNAGGSTLARAYVPFRSPMRIPPTLIATATDWKTVAYSAGQDVTAMSITANGNSVTGVSLSLSIVSQMGSLDTFFILQADGTAGRVIAFDAEL